jgi:hypothetical protein
MKDFPLTPQLKMIHEYSVADRLFLLNQICAEIYIARNISMNHETVLDNLGRIDRLYRTPSEGEEYETL